MSDQVSRASRWRPKRPLIGRRSGVGPVLALVIAVALAVPGFAMALASGLSALPSLVDLDMPHWVHNLADILQIVTPIIAVLAWGTARRRR